MHHFRHIQGLFNDHGNEFLRRCDDQDTVDGQGLEDRQGNVTCSRRHVDEHVVDIAPDDVGPELFNGAGNDRSAPYDRSGDIFQQQVHRHDFDASFGRNRIDAIVVAGGMTGQTEDFRNRRAGDIGVENRSFKAAALHFYSHQGRNQRFTYAAFAADDGNDVFDVRAFMGCSLEALRLVALCAGAAAAGTVVCTIFTHWDHSPLNFSFRHGSSRDGTSRNVHKLEYGRLR